MLLESKNDTIFLIDTKNYTQRDTKKYKMFWYRFEGNAIKFNGALKIRPINNHKK